MAIKKNISNELLIPSSWIRWIILCEELSMSKIDTDETRLYWYSEPREFFEGEKGESPCEEIDGKLLMGLHVESDYKQIFIKEFRSICCSPIEYIPSITSPKKAQEELSFFMQKMKSVTEETINLFSDLEVKKCLQAIISNCNDALGLLKAFRIHSDTDFYGDIDDEDNFGDLWDYLEEHEIGIKVGIGEKKEKITFSRQLLSAWYKCECCYDPETDMYGRFTLFVPKNSGLFFYVFMCLYAIDHEEYDGLSIKSCCSKLLWEDFVIPSDSLWIENLMENNCFIEEPDSSEKYIKNEDKAALEQFLGRKVFNDILIPEQLSSFLLYPNCYSFDTTERIVRINGNRLQTLSIIYLSLNKEVDFLIANKQTICMQFFASAMEDQIRADNSTLWEHCNTLERRINRIYFDTWKGSLKEVIEYELLKPSCLFDGKPALNSSVIYELVENLISVDKKLIADVYQAIQKEKMIAEVESITLSRPDNKDNEINTKTPAISEKAQKGLKVLSSTKHSLIVQEGERFKAIVDGGKIVECIIKSSHFSINTEKLHSTRKTRLEILKEMIERFSPEEIRTIISFKDYDGLIRKKGKPDFYSSRELENTLSKFSKERMQSIVANLSKTVEEKLSKSE